MGVRWPAAVACAGLALISGAASSASSPLRAAESSEVAASPPRLAPQDVVHSTIAPLAPVSRGSRGEVVVTLAIADGYHVMSERPSSEFYIATRVRLDPRDGLAWEEARYPEPVPFHFDGKEIATFEGTVVVRVPFSVAGDAPAGPLAIGGLLTYQACTKTRCLFPVKRPLALEIPIAP